MSAVPASAEGSALVLLGDLWRREPEPGLPPGHAAGAGAIGTVWEIDVRAQQKLEDCARSDLDNETGGLLLGRVYRERGVDLVRVTDILPARHTDSGPVWLTFTCDTWLDLIHRHAACPDKATVGWYHSHPGLGVFLSGSDRFIHKSFFGDQPWYIALVLDPLSGEHGVFVWNGTEIVRDDGPCAAAHIREGGDTP